MINLQKEAGQRILELGGAGNRHSQCDVNIDVREGPDVDFVGDFEKPLEVKDGDFDGIYCSYALEHVSYPKVVPFLKECRRVVKPGGRVAFITANTEAQFAWAKKNPNGWDGKSAFDSMSEVIFGSQSYQANAHKSYFSPAIVQQLFLEAGFQDVNVAAWGERQTDLLVQAVKPPEAPPQTIAVDAKVDPVLVNPVVKDAPPERMFDKGYWNGATGGFGGYFADQFGASYRDFSAHEITFRHIMARKPSSILEVGCSRGYLGWRLQNADVLWAGLEVSKHCWLTRACEGIVQHDLCKTPWPIDDIKFDLCFSIAVMEHVPEQVLPAVVKEMARTCKRGLHAIDFGANDDGKDLTHCTLRPKEWWEKLFALHAPGWPVEVVDKELLELPPPFHPGHVPPEWDLESSYFNGNDGLTKLNIGSYTTMHHQGWINLDMHDLGAFAAQNRYKFVRADIKQGVPWQTGCVDAIFSCHMLEHLNYQDGLNFLRECRRVIKPTGGMRIVVPDAGLLTKAYVTEDQDIQGVGDLLLSDFDEINDGSASCPTAAGKLWSLLFSGHQAAYDVETLEWQLKNSGWIPKQASFRMAAFDQTKIITRETIDVMPCLALVFDAVPLVE